MKNILISFRQLRRNMVEDKLLLFMLPAPLLMALLLSYGIPIMEKLLASNLGRESVLNPYLLLLYLCMLAVPSLIFAYAAVMTVLDELDDGTANYLCITPLCRNGYLISRFGILSFAGILYCIVLGELFPFTTVSMSVLVTLSILYAGEGSMISLFVISIAGNRVEGMALLKLSSLLLGGIPIPFFITGHVQYLACILPSFWLAKFAIFPHIPYLSAAVISMLLWNIILFKRFRKKIL